jgi:hypothetical protein
VKLKELGKNIIESLLGGDSSGTDIVKTVKGETTFFHAYSHKSEDDKPVGTLKVEKNVIIELSIEEDAKLKNAIETALLKAACKEADKSNLPLIIHVNAIEGGVKVLRDLEFFGFLKVDNTLERRPGAALPYSMFSS